ncbi:MAG: peptidylprolyl isomerase [Betaproteobacteria bacterium]|nr:peptidylprolyl isomerase [Betaproteobacteria bacterium]
MKRSAFSISLLAAALLALPGVAVAQTGAKSAIKVNGVVIPQSSFDAIVDEQKTRGIPDNEQLRAQVKEELVRREILAQAAKTKNLDKRADVAAQMDMARQAVLIRAYLQDHIKAHPVTDEAVRKEYENISKQLGSKEYKSRHILVEKEDDAKAIIERLKKGEKFEELAKQSKDPGSRERGGDLGWSSPAAYTKAFGEALARLEKGKTTDAPVKTEFGYHVIHLEDVRDLKAPSLAEVKPSLQQRLEQQTVEKHIMELRAKAKVE